MRHYQRRAAQPARPDMRGEVWRTLRDTKVRDVPAALWKCEPLREGAAYQLLEVLVTKLMCVVQPEFSWRVTAIGSDGGIDFRGERALFRDPALHFDARHLILGQCKQGTSFRTVNEISKALAHDVTRQVQQRPSHIYLVVATEFDERIRRAVTREFSKSFPQQFVVFNAQQLERLFAAHWDSLQPLVRHAIADARTCDSIVHFFTSVARVSPRVRISLAAPPACETARPFDVLVDVHVEPLHIASRVRLRWIPPERGGSLQLIVPATAPRESGIEISADTSGHFRVRLKFRSFVAGRQDLGTVVLTVRGSETRQPLGSIDVAELYHPVFYPTPFRRELAAFDEIIAQAAAGHFHVIAVRGAGGSGKTRLIEELGVRVEQLGGRYEHVAHPANFEQPYRVLGDLALRLAVPDQRPIESPIATLLRGLATVDPDLAVRCEPSFRALFETSVAAFDANAVADAVAVLILNAARAGVVCVHLSDLHWSRYAVLNVISAVVDRLRSTTVAKQVVFVLEGRTAVLMRDRVSSETWEGFSDRVATQRFDIEPLNSRASRGFLQHIFENARSRSARIDPALLPSQAILLEKILRYAEGNPFHMIEQVRYLRHQGVISVNRDTGLVFLEHPVDEEYDVPRDVEELIRDRFAYFERTAPLLAMLVRALALISDRVDQSLFLRLREELAPDVSDRELTASEFVVLSRVAGEVVFRHENYFQAIAALPLHDRDRVASIYLRWMDTQENRGPSALFDRARVMEWLTAPDRNTSDRLLREATALSRESHQYQLLIRLLTHRTRQWADTAGAWRDRGGAEIVEALSLREELAKWVSWSGDWEKARDQFKWIIETAESVAQTRRDLDRDSRARLQFMRLRCQVELGNVLIDTFQGPAAAALLRRTRREIEAYLRVASPDEMRAYGELRIRTENRLGVALWFDGDVKSGLQTMRASLHLATRFGDNKIISSQMRDLGTARLHTNPRRGLAMLSRSLDLVRTAPHAPRHVYIIQFQQAMARMAHHPRFPASRAMPAELRAIELELEDVYLRSRGEYVHEEAGSALMLGVAAALLRQTEADMWFMRCVDVAQQSSMREFAWKAHLNLAQTLLARGQDAAEAAALHADRAERMLVGDLETRTKAQNRAQRYAYYELPLAQLCRVWRILRREHRAGELLMRFPSLRAFFTDTHLTLRPNRHRARQVLHAVDDQNDYFMMS